MIDDVVEEVEKNILLKFLRTMQRIIKQQMNFDAKENDVILDTMCRSCHQLDVGIFCEEDPSPQRYNCQGKEALTFMAKQVLFSCYISSLRTSLIDHVFCE
jgi:hypothetical protein